MAIESMTGFAREAGTVQSGGSGGRAVQSWSWEIRSVNGRGLDLRVRVPPGHEGVADEVRKRATAAFARGTLHVNLTLGSDGDTALPRINRAALRAILDGIEGLDLPGGIGRPSLDGLLALRGVVEAGEDPGLAPQALQGELIAGFDRALAALKAARRSEGQALEAIILGQARTIERLTAEAEAHPARTAEAIRQRLAAQLATLLEAQAGLDPQRLHQEAALLAVKADIREELDRLKAHVAALRELLGQGGAIGRKLDFLSQEFGREASTLCAKAGDPGLSRIGLDLRTVVDQMREQVQNVE